MSLQPFLVDDATYTQTEPARAQSRVVHMWTFALFPVKVIVYGFDIVPVSNSEKLISTVKVVKPTAA